jgi:ElaB/YqjD/DUF883 family membrane-anchored ribosome-binding protein
MGQDPGTSRTALSGKDPDQLEAEIEATRREFGETVEALAAKTDVKAQAKRRLEDARLSVAGKKEELLGKAKDASPEQAAAVAAQLPQKAREHPVPLAAIGAFAAGFLAGRIASNR